MKTTSENQLTPEESAVGENILHNLSHPQQLEKMYRDNKLVFKKAFNHIYPGIKESITAQVWQERLNFDNEEISWGTRNEFMFVLLASALAALLTKIPQLANINPEYFYPRNVALIVFPLLTIYFARKQQLSTKKLLLLSTAILLSAVYINLLPDNDKSDTLILACIHLPLFLWTLLGFTFVGGQLNDYHKRLDFLRFNGDLVVMGTITLIAGGLLTGITLGLFELIQINIEQFYGEYIVVSGLAAAPIFATYLVDTNPQLVNKVSPVIAKIFTPLVLVTLVLYLSAIIYTGKDPYNDREFLIIFNLLLIGVMAIIIFSIAEISKNTGNKIGILLLSGLSVITIVVNGIALSAILFRITEWGITANRLAVLGGNILILTNLLLVTYKLFQSTKDRNKLPEVEKSIVYFLPVYSAWTVLVIFVFPLLFGFK